MTELLKDFGQSFPSSVHRARSFLPYTYTLWIKWHLWMLDGNVYESIELIKRNCPIKGFYRYPRYD
jgi:hypothetical protein